MDPSVQGRIGWPVGTGIFVLLGVYFMVQEMKRKRVYFRGSVAYCIPSMTHRKTKRLFSFFFPLSAVQFSCRGHAGIAASNS